MYSDGQGVSFFLCDKRLKEIFYYIHITLNGIGSKIYENFITRKRVLLYILFTRTKQNSIYLNEQFENVCFANYYMWDVNKNDLSPIRKYRFFLSYIPNSVYISNKYEYKFRDKVLDLFYSTFRHITYETS